MRVFSAGMSHPLRWWYSDRVSQSVLDDAWGRLGRICASSYEFGGLPTCEERSGRDEYRFVLLEKPFHSDNCIVSYGRS